MKVKLLRCSNGVYGENEYYSSYPDKETDYTGRWKIKVVNGYPRLYIECFEIVEVKRKVWVGDVITDRGWFDILRPIVKKQVEVIDRYRANVNWVHESELSLEVTEEYINECTCNESDSH